MTVLRLVHFMSIFPRTVMIDDQDHPIVNEADEGSRSRRLRTSVISSGEATDETGKFTNNISLRLYLWLPRLRHSRPGNNKQIDKRIADGERRLSLHSLMGFNARLKDLRLRGSVMKVDEVGLQRPERMSTRLALST